MNKLKILIVEDNAATRNLLEVRVKKDGYDVETSENGEKAVKRISEVFYDVIITDMLMPGKIDGMGVLEAAKAEQGQSEVIVITSYASVDKAVEAMKKGANDYLEKPVNFDELSLRLAKIGTLRALARETSDLREAMSVTEKNASKTIQDLEILVSRHKEVNDQTQRILEDDQLDVYDRIDEALRSLSSLQ